MRLIAFSLEGYRRFVARTSVKLHGDLIALVGPNEAGKSSLLRAISHLHNRALFEPTELPRRSGAAPTLAWHLQLEEAEKAAIAGIYDASGIERVVITKKPDGGRIWAFEPRSPKRDRSLRVPLAQALRRWREDAAIAYAGERGQLDLDEYVEALAGLDRLEDHEPSDVAKLRHLAESLVALTRSEAAHEDDAAAEAPQFSGFWDAQTELVRLLTGVAESEAQPSPWRRCVDALNPLVPSIEVFGSEDRELASQYDIDQVADNPPAALMHLAKLAGLDLMALRDEVRGGAIADVATRRNAANRQLLEKFDQSWNQQGIAVQVEMQGSILHIQATTPEDHGLSPISERSDGLRWFAALLAFADGWLSTPILLVDELETHLHYDAQADLIAVLAKQRFTSKVIYTTHSFGCLPYDLGTGVRVVQPIDAATSRLENGFWKAGAGFSPLLASMGAAAFSFTPTRHALIAEGPADAILLPSLIREATGSARLGYQIAPGLASVAAAAVGNLEAEAGRVAFITDGDVAGIAIRDKLTTAGIAPDRIIVLTDPGDVSAGYETEDLIDAAVYVKAVNDEMRIWNDVTAALTADQVPASFSSQAVERWCAEVGYTAPDKVAVAQRVVEMASDTRIVAAGRQALLAAIHARAEAILGIAPEV